MVLSFRNPIPELEIKVLDVSNDFGDPVGALNFKMRKRNFLSDLVSVWLFMRLHAKENSQSGCDGHSSQLLGGNAPRGFGIDCKNTKHEALSIHSDFSFKE